MMNKKRLQLNNVGNTRRTVARLCRDMYAHSEDDPLDLSSYRAILDGLKLLLAAYKTESDLSIYDRLDELEAEAAARRAEAAARHA